MTLKVNVKGNISIRRRIIVDGREYSSVEELPDDLRRAYERSMAGLGRGGDAADPAASGTRITFNGREYRSAEEMPEEIRRLYNAAMMTVEAHGRIGAGAAGDPAPRPAPLGPGGSTSSTLPSTAPIEVGGGAASSLPNKVALGIVILMLLGALYYLSRLF